MNPIRIISIAAITLFLSACSDVAIYKDCALALSTGNKFAEIRVAPNAFAINNTSDPSSSLSFTDGEISDGETISVQASNELFHRVVTIHPNENEKNEFFFFKINDLTKQFSMSIKRDGPNGIEENVILYGKCGIKGTQ